MKTLNSVSFVWPSEKSVFTLIGSELVECRIDQVTLIIEDDENGKRMTVSHYDISNNEGQITSLPNNTLFYKSPDAFRAGNQMDNCNYTGHDVLRTAIHHHAASLWYFNGVESVEYKPEEHVTKVTIDSNRRFNVAEGFVPSELFTKSGQVYAYNSVPIVDLDGNKTEKKGYLNPLLFNEKQKEIMVLEKMNDVAPVFDGKYTSMDMSTFKLEEMSMKEYAIKRLESTLRILKRE